MYCVQYIIWFKLQARRLGAGLYSQMKGSGANYHCVLFIFLQLPNESEFAHFLESDLGVRVRHSPAHHASHLFPSPVVQWVWTLDKAPEPARPSGRAELSGAYSDEHIALTYKTADPLLVWHSL